MPTIHTTIALGLAAAAMFHPVASAAPDTPQVAAQALAVQAVAVTEERARDIAWRNGIVIVEEIARNGHVWEVAGRDREGFEIVIDIDGRDGAVIR